MSALPSFDQLPAEDGVPMETPWHLDAMTLLIEVVRWLFTGRTDYFVVGNMFVCYSAEQAKTWSILWLGTWEGEFRGQQDVWPRFYDKNGRLLLTGEEAERQRAEAAEKEVARLKALLKRKGIE